MRPGRLVTWRSSGVRREQQLDEGAGIVGTWSAGEGAVAAVAGQGAGEAGD